MIHNPLSSLHNNNIIMASVTDYCRRRRHRRLFAYDNTLLNSIQAPLQLEDPLPTTDRQDLKKVPCKKRLHCLLFHTEEQVSLFEKILAENIVLEVPTQIN